MVLNLGKHPFLIFDLDDTLYKEYDFVASGFKSISNLYTGQEKEVLSEMLETFDNKGNVFKHLISNHPCVTIDKNDLIHQYRNHIPLIKLPSDREEFLGRIKEIGCRTGLLTDGRSVTQRNKIRALGLQDYFDLIVISEEIGSEKPALKNYHIFKETFGNMEFTFFGDNPAKDFLIPNSLRWLTIGLLDQGHNIHKQDFSLPGQYHPQYWISSFAEICLG